ncbi:MAG: LytR/AlgR family response regulator transcription factor [Lysobacteraceae bacterium]|nr:LytTR family DNA-binding domain-containing protein [Xanthomonadaceae bacterium]MCZ8319365.1 LytTR family DNA-binding domain-containing protein [Silanimonas sp.]
MNTTPIRVLLVDDVDLARDKLRRYLSDHADLEIVGEAEGMADAASKARTLEVDLVFLDIRLAEGNGLHAAASLHAAGQRLPLVVFVTAFAEHALEAWRLDAIDYLLKPVDRERVAQAIDRARRHLHQRPAALARRIALRVDASIRLLAVEDIEWIETARNYVVVHAREGTLISRLSLRGMMEELDPTVFVRVHRTALVNLGRVRGLHGASVGPREIELDSGRRIAVGRSFVGNLLEHLARNARGFG